MVSQVRRQMQNDRTLSRLLVRHKFAPASGEFRIKNHALRYPIVPSRVLIKTVKLSNGRFC